MDVLAGTLFNVFLSTALSAPRIWWDKKERSYEEAREQRLARLPKDHSIHRLRGKLSSVDLEEIEGRERKLHEKYEKHLHTSARDSFLAGTFWEGEDAIPPIEQDIVGSLSSFALPGQLYAGPNYSGGRFFGKNEKLTAKDLAVLPTSDWDLYSRSHDIRFGLISAIPDAEKRAELRNAANGIYHYQIYLSDDLPRTEGDGVEISQRKFTNEILPLLVNLYGGYNIVNKIANQVVTDVLLDVSRTAGDYERLFRELHRNELAGARVQLHEDYNKLVINNSVVHENIPVARVPIDRLLGIQHNISIPDANGDVSVVTHGPIQTGYRGPFYKTYLEHLERGGDTSVVFNDPDVRRVLRLPQFEDLVLRLQQAQTPQEARNLTRRIEGVIRGANYINNDTNLEEVDYDTFYNNGDSSEANQLPSVQQITEREVLPRIIGNRALWGKLATSVALDRLFKWTAERAQNRNFAKYAETNPELLAEIQKTVYPYERAHPFYKRLGEFLFRQGISSDIEHDPTLTEEDIKLYLSSLDHVAGDPVVDEIRKLYPFLPDHPVSEPEKVSGVEPVEEKETVTRPEIPTKADTSVDTSVDTPVDHVELSRGHTEDVLSFLLDSDEKIESLTLEEIAEILQLLS